MSVIAALIVIAMIATGAGLARVRDQHAVLRLGYELARTSDHVRALRETRRQLEIERAVLASPERIRRLANGLGMEAVSPDKIRIVRPDATAMGAHR